MQTSFFSVKMNSCLNQIKCLGNEWILPLRISSSGMKGWLSTSGTCHVSMGTWVPSPEAHIKVLWCVCSPSTGESGGRYDPLPHWPRLLGELQASLRPWIKKQLREYVRNNTQRWPLALTSSICTRTHTRMCVHTHPHTHKLITPHKNFPFYQNNYRTWQHLRSRFQVR